MKSLFPFLQHALVHIVPWSRDGQCGHNYHKHKSCKTGRSFVVREKSKRRENLYKQPLHSPELHSASLTAAYQLAWCSRLPSFRIVLRTIPIAPGDNKTITSFQRALPSALANTIGLLRTLRQVEWILESHYKDFSHHEDLIPWNR